MIQLDLFGGKPRIILPPDKPANTKPVVVKWFRICHDCVQTAITYLEKPVTIPAGTQFNLL
ncbi:hypothetical protein [Spirosoma fluviale]|uniref:Uncharacterized protein n=1 Tax=Spirosoma fluviale TaxID=1597977 RepID=A0A286FC66_9BACT|nr:hypothetical protein [Spirosoma fluviale]SOD80827.1 hypothetical protein SAMN06269250_1580 [Spirosoma fluviale]